MDSVDLFKIVPESEDSGYVRLREDPVNHKQDDKKTRRNSTIPVPSAGVSKLRISLSQEQLKINKPSSDTTQKPTPIQPNKDKHLRRVSLQSPIKQHTRFTNNSQKSITAKEAPNWSSKIICKLCDKPFSDPRVLACLHTFCLACLQKRLDSDSDVFRKSPCYVDNWVNKKNPFIFRHRKVLHNQLLLQIRRAASPARTSITVLLERQCL